MSFKDIIKKSILEGFSTDISTAKIVITLSVAVILGIYIFLVYKHKSKSQFYSKDFNVVLASLPIITAAIVLAMQSNLVISLGMVGALSIVRFRNAVKNSLDLLFLFWSISIGIICGAGIFQIAIILSASVTILILLLDLLPNKKKSLLLIINSKNIKTEEKLMPILKKCTSNYKIKSRSVSKNQIDLVIEVKCKEENKLITECLKIKDMEHVNLLSHDGETRL